MEKIQLIKLLTFLALSIPVIYLSRKNIFRPKSHGFYRFISWECILWLIVSNASLWFNDLNSIHQLISWLLLLYCIYPVTAGVLALKKAGKPSANRDDETLYTFEKTTKLVQTGVYKYIRHPLYSSLLFLTWGAFFKNPDFTLTIVAAISSVSLILTAKIEEQENLKYFGVQYAVYIKNTKMFIHYIL